MHPRVMWGLFWLVVVLAVGACALQAAVALDAAGQDEADIVAPAIPVGVAASDGATSPIVASVSWTASTDNVAVTGYGVWRSEHVEGQYRSIGTTAGTSFDDPSGVPGQGYYYKVAAYDAAGNQSQPSAPAGPARSAWVVTPHIFPSSSTHFCAWCHVSHAAAAGKLLRDTGVDQVSQENICYNCHDGSTPASNVASGTADSFALTSGHTLEWASTVATPAVGPGLTNECRSCHSLHRDSTAFPRLPASSVNSVEPTTTDNSWCEACHNAANDWYGADYPSTRSPARDATGYPILGTFPGPSTYESAAENAHASLPASETLGRSRGSCLYCHAAHRGASTYDGLVGDLRPTNASTLASDQATGAYAEACLRCHGRTAPSDLATRPADIQQFVTGAGENAGHRIKTAGGDLPVGAPLPCYECHNPHGSERGNSSLIVDPLGGGLTTSGAPENVRQFCFTCHTASDTARGWDSEDATFTAVSGGEVVGLPRTGGVLRLPAFPGHTEADVGSCYSCHGSDYDADGKNVHNPGAAAYDGPTHTAAPSASTYTIDGVVFGPRPCEECHDVELGPEHSKPSASSAAGGCGACHPVPRDTLVVWDRTCVQGGCHAVASSAPMHSSIDESHTVSGGTCEGAECHAGVSLAAIHSNAATTTPSGTLTGCQVCHGSDTGPTSDCGACHDSASPHGDEAALHAAAPGSGDVWMGLQDSDHNDKWMTEDCLRCHWTDLRTQHANACSTCHDGADPVGGLGTWDRTCQQGACHSAIHTGMTLNHNGVYYNSSQSCNECHDTSGEFPGPGDNCERCHSPEQTIPDGVPPVTSSDVEAAYDGTATIGFTAVDVGGAGVAATYHRLDLGVWVTGHVVEVVPPAGGTVEHTLSFYSADVAGNTETPHTVTFTVSGPGPPDTAGPVGTMTVNNGATYARGTASITSSVTDDGSGLYGMSVDPGTGTFGGWIAYTPTDDFTLPAPDGPKTVRVQYKDFAGNATTLSYDVVRDTALPSTTSSVIDGADYVGVQTFTFAPTDVGSGVASTRSRIDGGPWEEGLSAVVPAPESGSVEHALYWYSVDNAGNQENTQLAEFNMSAEATDTTPPVTTSSVDPPADAIYSSPLPISLTAIDDTGGSGVQETYYRIDSDAFVPGTSFTITDDGLHTFSYYSTDRANNTETVNVSNEFRIDTIAPSTTSDIVADATYTSAQLFSLVPTDTGSGVANTWWQLDGTTGTWTSGTMVPVTLPSSGTVSHTLYYYSTDNATHTEAVQSVTFNMSAITGTTTLAFRTNASFGGWSYVYWEVRDMDGNTIVPLEIRDGYGNALPEGSTSFENDDPAHPVAMWANFDVPAGQEYVMYGEWGPMPDGPASDSATRYVSPAEALPTQAVTWWWY